MITSGSETTVSAVTKASSLALCYWAVRKPKDKTHAELAFKAISFCVANLKSNISGKYFQAITSSEEKWNNLAFSKGFGPETPLAKKISEVAGSISGSSEYEREMIASCLVFSILGLRSAGATLSLSFSSVCLLLITYFALRFQTSPAVDLKILDSILHLSPSAVFLDIKSSNEDKIEMPSTSFGFEDVEYIFDNPISPQLMKDCEVQSYDLEAELVYDKLWWNDFPPCEDFKTPIKNQHGVVTGYFNIGPTNSPCFKEDYTIAPISGTVIKRTIVDAPPVSGYLGDSEISVLDDSIRANFPDFSNYDSNSQLGEDFVHQDGTWLASWSCPWQSDSLCHNISDTSIYEAYSFVNEHETSAGAIHSALIPWPGNTYLKSVALRHPYLKQGTEEYTNYWEDFSVIEKTGFALCPLEFSQERLTSIYSGQKYNPILNWRSIGRRAFSFGDPTSKVVSGTVGPPQPGYFKYTTQYPLDTKGGPFFAAHVKFENKTLQQKASITLFPTWPYKWPVHPTGHYYSFRTGGWDMPISMRYLQKGEWTLPPTEEEGLLFNNLPSVEINSANISNNWKNGNNPGRERHYKYSAKTGYLGSLKDFHPSGAWRTDGLGAGEIGNDAIEITVPQRIFGMGDACQDFPIKRENRNNANYPYVFHLVDFEAKDAGGSLLCPFSGNTWIKEYAGKYGVEGIFAGVESLGILGSTYGSWGKNYWNTYVTGWIYTGEEYAGKTVSCMEEITGYSIDSNKTLVYYHLARSGVPSYFPWSGLCALNTNMYLAPAPHISKCVNLGFYPSGCFDNYNTTTTTSTTTTTTTVDPNNPYPNWGGSTNSPSPYGTSCTGTPKALSNCPCDVPPFVLATVLGTGATDVRCYEECVSAECRYDQPGRATHKWDTGIQPQDWGWSELTTKQRTENPPRYWRGPYASTHFSFLYPNAQEAIDQTYQNKTLEITGFPWKVIFDVEIEEFLSKDICSGGYVDSNGETVWVSGFKDSETNKELPIWKTEKIDLPWSNLVDKDYAPEDAIIPQTETPFFIKRICDPTKTRNSHSYSMIPDFDWGNKRGTGWLYSYNSEGLTYPLQAHPLSKPKFGWGGFYRHTGYNFKIETTYAMPTFNLETFSNNYSQIISAFSVGNEIPYSCGYTLERNCKEVNDNGGGGGTTPTTYPPGGGGGGGGTTPTTYPPGGGGGGTTPTTYPPGGGGGGTTPTTYPPGGGGYPQSYHSLASENWLTGLDPVFLLPMGSEAERTGVFCSGLLNLENPNLFSGHTIHPYGTYGDGWFGLRSGSLFNSLGYAGNFSSAINCYLQPETGEETTTTAVPTTLPPYNPCDYGLGGEFLHGVLNSSLACQKYNSTHSPMGKSCDRLVWSFKLKPSSIDVNVRKAAYLSGYDMTNDNEYLSMAIPIPAKNPNAAPQFHYEITGTSALLGFNNPKINIFNPLEAGLNVHFETVVSDTYGTLYENPTGETWLCSGNLNSSSSAPTKEEFDYCFCSGSGHESILDLGKRIISNEEEPRQLNAYRWREMSMFKITMKNFRISGYDKMPVDSYFAMQNSGNCKVTGYFQYSRQEEASIYTEGIAVQDFSNDPDLTKLSYPNYASDVLKRPTIELPTGNGSTILVSLNSAPSRMQTRVVENYIVPSGKINSSWYLKLNTENPNFYNRYDWPTASDLFYFNGDVLSWESIPDTSFGVFPKSYLLISAAQGQASTDEVSSEVVNREYFVTDHWGLYDSTFVDPTKHNQWKRPLRTGFPITPRGGYFVPKGTTITDIKQGVVPAQKHLPATSATTAPPS